MLRFAFDDYWYLRGYFISLMLDIKDPIEGPWYDRNTVRQFITLWEYQWLVDSISPRLNQVGRKAKADSKRIAHLHAIAPNVGKTFDKGAYFDSRPHSAKQAQIIDSFFEEVTTTLISIDRWFAKEHWPDNFQVDELWGELNDISLQTATENAPFKRG
ncbi:hypothetical protein EON83_14565 [bacterium]|nr:MAG: hypothetical protein EON83_14565 [bacterium]